MAARDYADVAALLKKYTADQLIALAKERDPGLEDADFADAGQRLDRMRDSRLAAEFTARVVGADIAWLRKQFESWPREAAPRHAGA